MFTARDERSPSNSCVDAFLERIEELSDADWLRAGGEAIRVGERTEPAMLVDAFATQSALCVEAWLASDAVASIGWTRFGGRRAALWARAEHELLRAALDAARVAAVALCVRDRVMDQDFASVYRPFAAVIPVKSLAVMALQPERQPQS
jgi:hypothetical protein